MKQRTSFILCTLFFCAGLAATPQSQALPPEAAIANSPHNLSVSGPGVSGSTRSGVEKRICIFCHTPHHANPEGPLWSRKVPQASDYTALYVSPTYTTPQAPRSPSRLCLGCHDGTIALGQLGGYKGPSGGDIPVSDTVFGDGRPRLAVALQSSNANLGVDLSNDHPISFAYPVADPDFNAKNTLPAKGVKLDNGDYVECTSCHDPHNNKFGNFQVIDTSIDQAALCTACHSIPGWPDAGNAHKDDPGGGCLAPACHTAHNAPTPAYLMRAAGSPDTVLPAIASLPQAVVKYFLQTVSLALKSVARPQRAAGGKGRTGDCFNSCHQQTPRANVWNQFNAMAYTHPAVASDSKRHRRKEPLPLTASRKHVVCFDCHNPHLAVKKPPAAAPSAGHFETSARPGPAGLTGSLKGVRGIDLSGKTIVAAARYEYEICFKCHVGLYADQFTALSDQRPRRLFPAFDQSLRFSLSNPSFHPVATDRVGTGRSLLTSLQHRMFRIACTDCHHPHGSNEPHILQAQNWETWPSNTRDDYPLCFRCHDRDFLLNPLFSPHSGSAALHKSHVVTHRVPCSTCHDPHGVPAGRGAGMVNGAHLINFDTRYAGRNATYNAIARNCSVSCHAANPRSYTIN